jgi:hypothetical protein
MAEQKFTEAGELGRKARSALGSAYRSAKSGIGRGYNYIEDVVKEYGQEPLLNLYPQSVNLTAAGTEAAYGLAGKPASFGRYPYYNIPTQFDEQGEPPKTEEEPAKVKQEEIPTITVSKPKAKPNLWRVMLEGEEGKKDLFADTKEEAEYLLKQMGGKGAVAGIRIAGKNKEDEETLKEQYIKRSESGGVEDKPKKTSEQNKKYLATLERLRSGRESREAASREQIAKDRERFERFKSGGSVSQFASDIAAKRSSEDQLNQYNKQLSSLKKAYRNAGRAGDYVEQYRIGDFLNSYTAGIPKEMGARQKASQRGMIEARNKELEEKVRRDREARIAAERTSRANPDYDQYNSVY